MKYAIEIPCVDTTAGDRAGIRLLLEGSGNLRPSVPELLDVLAGEEGLNFTNSDGTPGQLRNVYASAHIVLGHRTISYAVRQQLKAVG